MKNTPPPSHICTFCLVPVLGPKNVSSVVATYRFHFGQIIPHVATFVAVKSTTSIGKHWCQICVFYEKRNWRVIFSRKSKCLHMALKRQCFLSWKKSRRDKLGKTLDLETRQLCPSGSEPGFVQRVVVGGGGGWTRKQLPGEGQKQSYPLNPSKSKSAYRWVPLNSRLIYQVKILRINWITN